MSAPNVDVLYLPIADLGARIRARRLSPVDLTEAYLERIHRLSPRLNAFQTVTDDLARSQARKAEDEIRKGNYRGPLHGIPYAAKDLFATAGVPTGWGVTPLGRQMFAEDATVIRKLREAGAILLGKTAMVEFAGGLGYRMPDASASGPGRNPWNTQRWTGGSSSGSGAAVAAGLASYALGTETWGSILCPSAFCGLTGIRPTYGRVSRNGAMVCSWTFDKVGPIAHSAEDCRTILSAIAGPDPADATSANEPADFPRQPLRPLNEIRAALVTLDFKVKGAQREVEAAFNDAVTVLRGAGLSLTAAKLPDFPASELAGVIITAEALSTFENFFRDGRVKQLKDRYAPYQPEINGAMTGADLMKAWRMRRELQQKMAAFFSDYDVIVTPNFQSVAPSVDRDLYETLPYADPVGAIGNACGLPAIALPCGFGEGHMPVGFQILAAPYNEALLLDLGERYQSRTAFHRERPPLT